jgi:hypothetical protein
VRSETLVVHLRVRSQTHLKLMTAVVYGLSRCILFDDSGAVCQLLAPAGKKNLPVFPTWSHSVDTEGKILQQRIRNKNRINAFCSLIAVFAAFLISPQGRAANLYVSSPSPVNVGDSVTVEVDVSLAPGETLFGFQMDVLFPSFLEADNVTELGYFASDGCCFFPGFIDNTGLDITFINDALSGSDLMTNSGALFNVTFTALAPGMDSVTVDPTTVILLSDPNGDQLPVDISAGIVNATTPEPSTALLLVGGAGLLALVRRRRKGRSK